MRRFAHRLSETAKWTYGNTTSPDWIPGFSPSQGRGKRRRGSPGIIEIAPKKRRHGTPQTKRSAISPLRLGICLRTRPASRRQPSPSCHRTPTSDRGCTSTDGEVAVFCPFLLEPRPSFLVAGDLPGRVEPRAPNAGVFSCAWGPLRCCGPDPRVWAVDFASMASCSSANSERDMTQIRPTFEARCHCGESAGVGRSRPELCVVTNRRIATPGDRSHATGVRLGPVPVELDGRIGPAAVFLGGRHPCLMGRLNAADPVIF